MEAEQLKIKDHFSKHLKAADYVFEMSECWKDAPELFQFMIKFIHDAFSSGNLLKNLNQHLNINFKHHDGFIGSLTVPKVYCCTFRGKFQGSKLLEIGSGVLVHSIASASRFFPNIVMSDYVENNVEELRKWLKGQSSIKQFLDVQAEIEGYGNDMATGINIIESRIRKNVKRVTRCDVTKDGILLEKDTNPETSPPYDVVVSCLCLEVCPVDVKGYGDIMKRINTLIKPGGGLLLAGFFQGSTWIAGGHSFPHIKIDQPDLIDALTNAGFGNIEIKSMGKDDAKYTKFTYKKLFCLVAKKLNDINA